MKTIIRGEKEIPAACVRWLMAAWTVMLLMAVPTDSSANLLSNPGFEDGTSWVYDYSDRQSYAAESGTYGVRGYGWNASYGLFYQQVVVTNNIRYYFRIRSIKNAFPNRTIRLRFRWVRSNGTTVSDDETSFTVDSMSSSWSSYGHDATPPSGAAAARVWVQWDAGATVSSAIYWDNAMLYSRNEVYRDDEIVEEFSYDAGYNNSLDGKDRGHGFSDTWTESTPGQFIIATGSFANITGYLTNFGQKVMVVPNNDTRTALRSFAPIASGTVYAAYIMNFQYNGADKWCGLSFMSNTTEKAYIGEINGADLTLGIDSFGGGGAISASYGLNNGMGNDYLIVAAYDFESRKIRTKGYWKTDTVPVNPPTEWNGIATAAVGRINSIDGIRLGAGGNTPGECYFDEVRVARDWASLVGISRPPLISNVVINGGSDVTDGQVAAGSIGVSLNLHAPSGIETTNTLWPMFQPNFDIVDPNGSVILTNRVFSQLSARASSGQTVMATNLTHTPCLGTVTLGVYTVRVSAISSNGSLMVDQTMRNGGSAITFTVVDDDTTAPSNFNFNIDGQFYSTLDLGGGLNVTGQVQDFESGVYAGNSNRWSLTRNGSAVNSGTFTNAPAANGDAKTSPGSLGVTLGAGDVQVVGVYTLYVESVNYDVESLADGQKCVNYYVFQVFQGGAYDFSLSGSGMEITNNACPPISANGTDFGSVVVAGGSATSEFTIVNTTAETLTLGTVTISGPQAGDFSVLQQPSSPIAMGQSTTFKIVFDPSDTGLREATVNFTNNSDDKNPFAFDIKGMGGGAWIVVDKASLSFEMWAWTASSNLTLTLTNTGGAELFYTNYVEYGSGYGWMAVNPESANLPAGDHSNLTVTISPSSLGAGSYEGEIRIDGNQINPPQTVTVSLVVNGAIDPVESWARLDGYELVRPSWSAASGFDTVMVAYNNDQAPQEGVVYGVGDALGGGHVVYRGTGNTFEHVIPSNTAARYTFYSVKEDSHYSPGAIRLAHTPAYPGRLVWDQFCYTNGASLYLDERSGGCGWTGVWAEGSTVGRFAVEEGSLAAAGGNMNYANKIKVEPDVAGEYCLAERQFAPYTSGLVYVSCYLNFTYDGPRKFAGVSLTQGGVEEAFFGELFWRDETDNLGIDVTNLVSDTWANASYTLNNGAYEDYLIVGMYDFGTTNLKVHAFHKSEFVPSDEPASWLATKTLPAPIELIDGVRISAGAEAGYGTPGPTYFDEVRVGTNWTEVVGIQTTLQFAGYTWNIKNGFAGPGYNWFSTRCARVDTNGWLHLDISVQTNYNEWGEATTNWSCGEVACQQSLGYGQYTWYVNTPVTNLDTNAIAGLFTYEDDYREIDIEFTQAFIPTGNIAPRTNFNYSIQPAAEHQTRKMHRDQTNDLTTHGFLWNPRQVDFFSWHGHSLTPPDDFSEDNLYQWTYKKNDVPRAFGLERPVMNMWLYSRDSMGAETFQGKPPAASSTPDMLKIVLKDFRFIPSPRQTPELGAAPLRIQIGDQYVNPTNNLLANAGFESGTPESFSPWARWGSSYRDPLCAESGTGGVRVASDPDASRWNGIMQTLSAEAGEFYVFNIRGKTPNGSMSANAMDLILAFDTDTDYDNGVLSEQVVSSLHTQLGGDWTLCQVAGQAPDNTAYLHARISLDALGVSPPTTSWWDNAFVLSRSAYTGAVWEIYDNQLGGDSRPEYRMIFNVSSTNLGLSRGNDDPTTQMNVSVGSWLPDADKHYYIKNVSNYLAAESTPYVDTTNAWATSVWYWASVNDAGIGAMISNYHHEGSAMSEEGLGWGYNPVSAVIFNTSSNQPYGIDQAFGYLHVIDDDPEPPVMGVNLLENAGFEQGITVPGVIEDPAAAESWDYEYAMYTGNNLGGNDLATRKPWKPHSGFYSMTMHNFRGLDSQMDSVIWQNATNSFGNDPIASNWVASVWLYREANFVGSIWMNIEFFNDTVTNKALNDVFEIPAGVWVQKFVSRPLRMPDCTHVRFLVGAANMYDYGDNSGVLYIDDLHLSPMPMHVRIGATDYRNGLVDAELSSISGINPFRAIIHAFDAGSGLRLGDGHIETQSMASINGLFYDSMTNYIAAESSADTLAPSASNVWKHMDAIPSNTIWSWAEDGFIRVDATLRDNDFDWQGDRGASRLFMRFPIIDDDTNGPIPTLIHAATGTYTFGDASFTEVTDGDLVAGGKLNLAYSWYDESGMFATNNINATNSNPAWGNVTPCYRLTNQWNALWVNPVYHSRLQIFGGNGDLSITNIGSVPAVHSYDIGDTGVVYVVPIGQDHDQDWGFMRKNQFLVNPGFENGGENWDLTGERNVEQGAGDWCADSGEWGVWITNRLSGMAYFFQQIAVLPSQSHRFTIRARKVGAMNPASVGVQLLRFNGSDWVLAQEWNIQASLTENWQTFSWTHTPVSSPYRVLLYVWNGTGAGSGEGLVYFDNASFHLNTSPTFNGDRACTYNVPAGSFMMVDDDTNPPVAELLFAGSGYSFGETGVNLTDEDLAEGPADFAYRWTDPSGIHMCMADGTSNANPIVDNITPFASLSNQTTIIFSNRFHTASEIHGTNGHTRITNVLTGISFPTVQTGLWYLTVGAQDYDNDRGAIEGLRLKNGNFSQSITNWTKTSATGEMYFNGATFYMVLYVGNYPNLYQTVACGAGEELTLSADARKSSSYPVKCQSLLLILQYDDDNNYANGCISSIETNIKDQVTTSYQTFSLSGCTPVGTRYVRALMFNYNQTSSFQTASIYWDNVAISNSDGRGIYNKDRAVEPGVSLPFTVTDDDQDLPVVGKAFTSDRALDVWVNGAPAALENALQTTSATFRVTDGDLNGGTLRVAFSMFDRTSGLCRATSDAETNTTVTIGSWAVDNVANYQVDSSSSMEDTKTVAATSVWEWASLTQADVEDLYNGGVSNVISATLRDADHDRAGDQLHGTNMQYGYLKVIDDDTEAPAIVNIYSVSNMVTTLRYLHVTVGDQDKYASGDVTNRQYVVTDGELADLSYNEPLRFSLGARDDSGIHRASAGATNMRLSIGSVWSDNTANFMAGESTPFGSDAGLNTTNVWRFDSVTAMQIEDLYAARTNTVIATLPDRDHDRTGDQRENVDQQYGYLVVNDDDEVGPVMGYLQAPGSILLIGTGFENADGWTNATYSSSPWTQDFPPEGPYYGYSCFAGLAAQRTGSRGVGFNEADDYLRLPPVDKPGTLRLWGCLSSGTGPRSLEVQRADGASWVGYGVKNLTSAEWTLLEWDIDYAGNDITLRVARVGSASQTIYIDDMTLSSRAEWINTNSVTVVWNAAEDASGLYQYRYVAPAQNSSPPVLPSQGTLVDADISVTTVVMDVSAHQGVLTGFVFSVDNDDDRTADQAKGDNLDFVVKIDRTAPPGIVLTNAEADMYDITSILVQWDPAADAGERGDGVPLSPWKSYVFFLTTEDRDPLVTDEYISMDHNGSSEMGQITNRQSMLTNLLYGVTYRVAIAGMDEAGNLGPLSDNVREVFMPGFHLTNGTVNADLEAPMVEWNAVSNREHDLIYVDAYDFSDALSNQWQLVDRGVTNMLADTGGGGRPHPKDLVGKMRFYRAALRDRWTLDRSPRQATEEVYVWKTIQVNTGRNWVAFPGIPVGNTAAGVLGHDLPAAPISDQATRVAWFERTDTILASNQIWLCDDPLEWRNMDNESADDMQIPYQEGCVVEVPGSEMGHILFLGIVPTNTMKQTIKGKAYNYVASGVPTRMHPSQLKLVEAGFTGDSRPSRSDILRKYNRWTQQLDENWGSGLFYDTSTGKWRVYKGSNPFLEAPVNDSRYWVGPDDGLLIQSKHTGDWEWTNQIPYSIPNRFMNP